MHMFMFMWDTPQGLTEWNKLKGAAKQGKYFAIVTVPQLRAHGLY